MFGTLKQVFIFLLFISPFSSWAGSCWNQGGNIATVSATLPATLIVQKDAEIGSVLWDSGWVYSGQSSRAQCNGSNNEYRVGYETPMTPASGYSNFYNTTNSSIGVKIVFSNTPNTDVYNSFVNYPDNISYFSPGNITFDYPITPNYKVTFIALSQPKSGTITFASPLVHLKYNAVVMSLLSFSSTSIIVKSTSCTISTPSINIAMGDFSNSLFTAIGSTPISKGFNVGLKCDEGAKINVSMSGTANTDTSKTDVIALSNYGTSGVANGLGVQILYNGTTLNLNKNIVLKTSAGGNESMAFTARYYQTKGTVTVGKANATATLNITYQ